MPYLNFNSDKKSNKSWRYIEKVLPGSKTLLEDVYVMLTVTNGVASIRQNMKQIKNKDIVIYKYHIEQGEWRKKLCTIYLQFNKQGEFMGKSKIRIFSKVNSNMSETEMHKFSSLDELKDLIINGIM